MAQVDRRAFLRKMAKGAAYSAPVVYSMAAPVELVGQGKSSGKGGDMKMGGGMGGGGGGMGGGGLPPGSVPPGG